MSNCLWRGDAAAVAQVNTLTVAGTAASGQIYTVTISNKAVSYTATGTDTNTTIATSLWTALSQSTIKEFQDAQWTNPSAGVIVGKATLAGVPFTQTSAATGTGTLTTVNTTPSSGPADLSVPANWSGGALPVSGDSIFFQDSSAPCLYGLTALATVTPALVQVDASYTGQLGLPYSNLSGYVEYRQRYLQLAGWTLGNIGLGQGSGSSKIQLDAQANDHTTNVWNMGSSSEQGVPALLLRGGSAATKLTVLKGTAGVALFAGETAQIPTLNIGYVSSVTGDANVTLGTGATVNNVTKTGGALYAEAAVPNLTSYAGTTTIVAGNMTNCQLLSSSAAATANKVNYSTGGTITTNVVQGGCTLDFSGTLAQVTLTNSTWYAGATVNGPSGNVVMSNHASLPDAPLSAVNVNLGTGRHVLVD